MALYRYGTMALYRFVPLAFGLLHQGRIGALSNLGRTYNRRYRQKA